MRRRICLFSPRAWGLFAPDGQRIPGGAELNLVSLAREWAKLPDVEVVFLVGDFGQASLVTVDGIEVRKVAGYSYDRRTLINQLWQRVSLLRELWRCRADVYLCSTPSEAVAYMTLASLGRRDVVTAYRFASDREITWTQLEQGRFVKWLFQWGIRRCHVLVAQNSAQRRLLREKLKLHSRIIKNGFPLTVLPRPSQEERNCVLWVGRPIPLKRGEMFLELARRVPEIDFVMILPGAGTLAEMWRVEAERLPNVRFLPGVVPDGMDEWYRHALCLVNTSTVEGFPNAFIQAAQWGTPLLSLLVNPNGMFDDGALGVMANDRLDEAARFLLQLKEDPLLFERHGAACRAWVMREHDVRVKAREYMEAFVEAGTHV